MQRRAAKAIPSWLIAVNFFYVQQLCLFTPWESVHPSKCLRTSHQLSISPFAQLCSLLNFSLFLCLFLSFYFSLFPSLRHFLSSVCISSSVKTRSVSQGWPARSESLKGGSKTRVVCICSPERAQLWSRHMLQATPQAPLGSWSEIATAGTRVGSVQLSSPWFKSSREVIFPEPQWYSVFSTILGTGPSVFAAAVVPRPLFSHSASFTKPSSCEHMTTVQEVR